jgi:hypothetical protein
MKLAQRQVVIDDAIPFDSAMNPLTARTKSTKGTPKNTENSDVT